MWYRTIGKKNASYEESKRSKDSLFSDFFTMFFGSVDENKPKVKNKKAPSKGENIETEINISIEDAFRGKEQTIGVRTVEGKLKKFKVFVPAGIQNNEKIRYVDMLTCLKNRNYLNDRMEIWNQNTVYPQAVVVLDLNNVKYLNDTFGHEEGDKQIKAAANALFKTQLENTELIRTDGNEFLIYLVGYSEKQIISYLLLL